VLIVTVGPDVSHELSVVALIRGKERFVYIFDDNSGEELLETLP
jgi:hypothetical protein